MPVGRVSLVTADIAHPPLFALSAGETATAREVLETASEEPDFGMDVGLFTDNKTAFGAEYGFGTQPFGNPELDYGTQAPFHMAFFHENFIIKLAAPFSKISHVEYRIRLYTALASFAFKTGHDYWGYRFAGWALHYIQDMAVPYHARMTPGIGTLRLIWANLFYSEEKRNGLLNILSNRHLVFEKYQYYALIDLMGRKAHDNLLLSALADTSLTRKPIIHGPLRKGGRFEGFVRCRRRYRRPDGRLVPAEIRLRSGLPLRRDRTGD